MANIAVQDPCAGIGIYKSMDWCNGKTVLPGIRQKVFFIPKRDILKWPVLPDLEGATDMAKLAAYEGDFVLAADKKWLILSVLTAASSIKAESQGDKPSRTFNNQATLKYAGIDEAATGFCRQANSDDLVYLVQQRDGKFRVLGNTAFETDTKPAQDSGANVTDASGTTLEVSATDVCPSPYYPGKIETEAGVLSGKDGTAYEEPATPGA